MPAVQYERLLHPRLTLALLELLTRGGERDAADPETRAEVEVALCTLMASDRARLETFGQRPAKRTRALSAAFVTRQQAQLRKTAERMGVDDELVDLLCLQMTQVTYTKFLRIEEDEEGEETADELFFMQHKYKATFTQHHTPCHRCTGRADTDRERVARYETRGSLSLPEVILAKVLAPVAHHYYVEKARRAWLALPLAPGEDERTMRMQRGRGLDHRPWPSKLQTRVSTVEPGPCHRLLWRLSMLKQGKPRLSDAPAITALRACRAALVEGISARGLYEGAPQWILAHMQRSVGARLRREHTEAWADPRTMRACDWKEVLEDRSPAKYRYYQGMQKSVMLLSYDLRLPLQELGRTSRVMRRFNASPIKVMMDGETQRLYVSLHLPPSKAHEAGESGKRCYLYSGETDEKKPTDNGFTRSLVKLHRMMRGLCPEAKPNRGQD